MRMDDGVDLAATLVRPSADGTTPLPGPYPVVVSLTPYGRTGMCGCPDPTMFASRGIAAAVVDVRGTGGSGGNLDGNYFSPREARDGYLVVEHFGTAPWSSGPNRSSRRLFAITLKATGRCAGWRTNSGVKGWGPLVHMRNSSPGPRRDELSPPRPTSPAC